MWQEECDSIPKEDRKEYAFLLMGQGGSGKTAIVQETVLELLQRVGRIGGRRVG